MFVRPPTKSRAFVALALVAILLGPLFVTTPARAALSIKVNFQRPTATIPAGYLRDYGQPYGPRTDTGQGTGQTYGWLSPATAQPLDLSVGGTTGPGNGRDRNYSGAGLDQRLDTLIHMQADDIPGTFSGVKAEGYWEIAVPNDTYDVTVAAGDATAGTDPESHTLRVEGQPVFQNFVPEGGAGSVTRFKTGVIQVTVADGKLTVDAQGGTNTKINYIDIVTSNGPLKPRVMTVTPGNATTNVVRNTGVVAGVFVPNGGIRADSVNTNTVFLVRQSDSTRIAATVNTTGGGDSITLQPNAVLDPDTAYIFNVTSGVVDAAGTPFEPFSSTFTTGQVGGTGSTLPVSFEQIRNIAAAPFISGVTIGPDGKLYAVSLEGYIYRYTIGADGRLSGQQVIATVRDAAGGTGRAIIGLAFDPAATANNLILWISHNGPYVVQGADDWTGKISRLSGPNLEVIQDYVINLPHSFKDHMVNGVTFRPGENTALYVSVGSNSAMGAPDAAWGQRPERLLSGTILRVDLSAITAPPLNVKTEDGGTYNPFAVNAQAKFYATGVRNAFDLLWHSNGQLYAPTNGSAAGGTTPATPAALPAACANRVDSATRGAYTGPQVPSLTNVAQVQKDWLFRIAAGGYYGHPNPLRCEWVMNAGNLTAGTGNDGAAETPEYPAGVQPDRNYRGFAYDFGINKSPNGVIEYKSDVFGPVLKGKVLVVRYSQGKDIVALQPNTGNGDIGTAYEGMPGMTGFDNPLDLVENVANGNLYIVEFGSGASSNISLLRPLIGNIPQISATPSPIYYTDKADATPSAAQVVTVRNIGSAQLTISNIALSGAGAGSFQITNTPATSIAQGDSTTINVVFTPAQPGPAKALLRITSNAANAPTLEIPLRGLGVLGTGGTNEPSLQWILDTYDIPVNTGDPDPTNNAMPTNPLLGEEVAIQTFERSDNANPVIIQPLAVFGPTGTNPVTRFGWYLAGNPAAKNELFAVGNDPASNGQRVDPVLEPNAARSFDPGTSLFGFYSIWPFFGNREVFGEDALNTWEPTVANRHKVRVYPLKDSTGAVVPNAYVVAFEETTSGYDYQDVAVVVRNVRLAGSGAPTPPNAPANVIAAAGISQVSLSWASGGGTPPDSYKIYRSTTPTVATTGLPLATVTSTSYIDTAVTNGTTYYYAIVAAAGSQVSPRSAIVNAKPAAASGSIAILNLDKVPYNDRLVFNRADCCTSLAFHRDATLRITNTSQTEPLNVSKIVFSGIDASWFRMALAADGGPYTIAPGASRDVVVRFVRDQNFTGATEDPNNPGLIRAPRNAILTINSSASNNPAQVVQLSGFNMPLQGGVNESNLQEILDNFGYGSIILYPGQSLRSNNGQPVGSISATGEEVLSGLWLRANSEQPVYARQIVASSRSAGGEKMGIANFPLIYHGPNQQQSYLPLNNQTPAGPTEMTITPSTATPFQIYIAGLGSNRAYADATKAQAVRFWPMRDRDGVLVPNTYVVGQDYVSDVGSTAGGVNFDYQDNVYIITNIRPANVANDPTLGNPNPGAPSLVLDFDNANYPGTLQDAGGLTIGFPDTQRNKVDTTRPDLPPTASYNASKLTLNTGGRGTLTIGSTDGVNSNALNSLVNGLCLPFDGRASKFQMSARLVGPFTFTKAFQQAGLMFGPNHDYFIKLVAGVRSGTNPTIYLAREQAGVLADAPPAAEVPLPNQGAIQTLELRLVADPISGVVEGFYSIDGAAFQRLAATITLTGTDKGHFFDKISSACTLTSQRLSGIAFNAVYDRFAVELPTEITTNRQVLLRYNAGGATVPAGGFTWQADAGLFTPTSSPDEPSATPPTAYDVANTTADRIYQDYRGKVLGAAQDQRTFSYNIPLPDGRNRVAVRLHFAELYWGLSGRQGPNKRLFDIYAEGKLALRDFDIFSAAGAARTAVVVPIENIDVPDGVLTLTFVAKMDQVSVGAIEVLAALEGTTVVNAGPDQKVNLGATVQLAGSVSGNTSPVTLNWTQIDGPAVTLNGATTLTPSFTAPGAYAVLTFRLAATPGQGQPISDTVQITVGETPITGLTATNDSPKQVGQLVTLTAALGSGENVTYTWNFGDGTNGVGASATHAYTAIGTYQATVTATNSSGAQTATTTVTITGEPAFELRINAGGPTYTDLNNRAWVADQNFVGGSSTTNANVTTITNGNPNPDVYKTARVGATVNYNIPVPAVDEYVVTLHFAEIYFGAPGGGLNSSTQRIFDLNVVDAVVPAGSEPEIDNLNLRQQVGSMTAYRVTYTVRVTDGILNLTLNSLAANGGNNNALISGVEVVRVINSPPTVNAGADQTVQPGTLVTLNGTVSDPEGGPTTFSWSKTAGPDVTLNGATTLSPSFTPATKGVYTFRLSAQDAENNGSFDTVNVTVSNRAPTVSASATPETVDVGQASTLAASASDPDGDTLRYAWTQTAGPNTGSLTGATTASAIFTPVEKGTYTFSVTVNDGDGGQATATVTVTVRNQAPVANAGADQSVDVGATVQLDGSASTDPDDDTLTYAWTSTNVPAVPLTGATTATPTFTAPAQPATLVFNLIVTDSDGLASVADSVTITVKDIAVTGLSAISDSPTVLGQTTTFTASLTTGSNASYSWDFGDGSTATGANAQHVFAGAGTFTVTVTATNSQGQTTAEVNVTVTNAAPIADAGSDQDVNVGGNVQLDGRASSDPDGHTPLTYAWRQTDGPAVVLTGATTAQPTFTAPGQPATLTFELIVTDSRGLASVADTVTVSDKEIPVADLSIITDAPTVLGQTTGFTATLSNGSNVTYAWDFGDGATANGVNAQHTFTAAGTFTVTLKATNSLGTTTVEALVTVTNAAPVADAGADKQVLVGASVELDGSASSDADGHTPLAYSWVQTGGPAVALNGTTTATISFVAPAQPAGLLFTLIVTDSKGLASEGDTVAVVVVDSGPAEVTASNDGPTSLGKVTILTAATQASNPVYSWDFGDGATGSGASPTHTYAQAGTYVATVTVSNATGLIGTAITIVEIINNAPIARPGSDQSVPINAKVTLDGSTSSDADGHTPLTYEWVQTGGPAVVLTNPTSPNISFTAPAQPALLFFKLTVTDSRNLSGDAIVQVAVGDVPITSLQATSSSPTILGKPTTFSVSATGGSNVVYTWDFGGGKKFTGPSVQFTFTAEGSYQVTVTARNAVSELVRSLTIVVRNAAPVVNGGPDQNVRASTLVLLKGSASDADNQGALKYSWTQIAGPAVSLLNATSLTPSFTAPAVKATLIFKLTVSDIFGKNSSDTITVEVNEGQNSRPATVFLPQIMRDSGKPLASPADLAIGAFTVTPANLEAGKPAQLSVTVTNKGGTATGAFWVDLYINPNSPPTVASIPWENTCTLSPCYGAAWLVNQGLAPGASIVLTLDPSSYYGANTNWVGSFAPGTNALYVYVDSWNLTNPAGIVTESNEANNRAEIVVGKASMIEGTNSAPERPRMPERFIP